MTAIDELRRHTSAADLAVFLRERIMQTYPDTGGISQLDPATVLGLAPGELEELRRVAPGALERLDRVIGHRRGLSHVLAPPAAIRSRSRIAPVTANRVAAALGNLARELGVALLIEEMTETLARRACDGPQGQEEARVAPDVHPAEACVVLAVCPVSSYSDTVVIDRKRYASLPNWNRDPLPGAEAIAYRLRNGALLLRCHPFVRNGAWSAGTIARGIVIVRQVVEAAIATGVIVSSRSDHDSAAHVRQAIQALDALPALAQAQTSDRSSIVALENRLAGARSTVDDARRSLLHAMQAEQEMRAELELARVVGPCQLGGEALERLLRELLLITRQPNVRRVEIVPRSARGGTPRLRITFNALVLAHQASSYLIAPLTFYIPLASSDDVRFDPNCSHPHVNPSSHRGCFGDVEVSLRDALIRREYAAACVLIGNWASHYNARSPYVHIDAFPICSLEPGWYPEL